MTNKEKALMLVWDHLSLPLETISLNTFINNYAYYVREWDICKNAIQHAKITATKIAEYNPEEGKVLLEELEKI